MYGFNQDLTISENSLFKDKWSVMFALSCKIQMVNSTERKNYVKCT